MLHNECKEEEVDAYDGLFMNLAIRQASCRGGVVPCWCAATANGSLVAAHLVDWSQICLE
jgi:hypothetical protein